MILVIMGGSCSGKTEFSLACEKYGFKKVITNTVNTISLEQYSLILRK